MSVHAFPVLSRTLNLGFLCPYNPYDRRSFSGSSFFAAKALEDRPDVSLKILGGHRRPGPFDRILRRNQHTLSVSRADLAGLDAVVGLVATAALNDVARKIPGLPLIHVTDATPAFLRDVYGWSVPAKSDTDEARLVRHAAATVYSSDAMCDRATMDLGTREILPFSVPFGINLDRIPAKRPEKQKTKRINLLFIGLDWVRKGGDVAVAALNMLRAEGHDAELSIVGRCPETLREQPGINAIGFLNKNKPRDSARLAQLMADAHLLLLPTRGDCAPMVLAEAMAYGTPVIATEIGGVASILGGDGTGRLLPPHAPPEEWVKSILELASDPDRYQFYADACFERATKHLTWNNWSEAIVNLAGQIISDQDQRGLNVAIGT